ncbi:putative sodium-dependent multivitamin transporter isoform X4 [Ceratina calcarata]|uniref:Sodium-dependent multivitamin transporter isoform X3 n=1 Tax=Ceratina calcarata TaxID=156304 RepID=A0AAJ7SBZ9_9HYME|nr:putative sodium-dependent multivitamin transporter isoform X3 [Ceratina calcarata]XP_026675243.1 putative sodium-dependent multivitamin transporter isoform X4 [Ceratina calcarata]
MAGLSCHRRNAVDLSRDRTLLPIHRGQTTHGRGVLLGEQINGRGHSSDSSDSVFRVCNNIARNQRGKLRLRDANHAVVFRWFHWNADYAVLLSSRLYRVERYERVRVFGETVRSHSSSGNQHSQFLATPPVHGSGVICAFDSARSDYRPIRRHERSAALLMFAGIACVLGVAAADLDGSLSNVWSIAQAGGRIEFFDFRIDPTIRHTWWSLLVGSTTFFLSLYAVNQVQVQRLLTAKDKKTSTNALFLSGPITMALGVLTSFCGLAVYAVYKDCDPFTSGKITMFDMILPYFAADRMSRLPGITGLFISGVFSASLSTISAMLNSLAAVALEDYVKPACHKFGMHFSSERATMIGKALAIMNGFLCLSVAFLAKSMGSLIQAALSISGAIGGPILGIFTLGMFIEAANETGAIVGMVSALTICIWAALGSTISGTSQGQTLPLSIDGCDNSTLQLEHFNNQNIDNSSYLYLYRISYMWYTPLGLVITLLVGYVTSLVTNRILYKNARELNPSLFVPMLAARIRRRREDAAKTTSSQMFVLENRK